MRRALSWEKTVGFLVDLPLGTGGHPTELKWIPSSGWQVLKVLLNAADRGSGQRRWRLVAAGRLHKLG